MGRAYVDGNGGNISVRVATDLVLCTPTLVSKGFMQPADLALVDMEGTMVAGDKRRTSEVLMHLEIYAAQPTAEACVHAHPPCATGYAVGGVSPPAAWSPRWRSSSARCRGALQDARKPRAMAEGAAWPASTTPC